MLQNPKLRVAEHVSDAHGVRRYLMSAVENPRGIAVELHGSGLDPERQDRASGLAAALAREGIVTLLPQGAIPFQLMPVQTEPPGYVWNVPGVPLPLEHELRPDLPNDAGWICDLVDHVRATLGTPSLPVMIVGYSAGARLASHIVVRERIEWTAAAFVAGLRPTTAAVRAMPPTIAFHGREDRFAPYEGGQPPRWNESVDEAARRVAHQAGIDTDPVIDEVDGGRCHRFSSSDGKETFVHYVLDAAGHAWPGSHDEIHCATYGGGCTALEATSSIVKFFAARL